MTDDNELYSRDRAAGHDPRTLFDAKVAQAGVGALGQNTIQNLMLSGIGRVAVVDYDVFEEHNRTRSPFFPSPNEVREWGLEKARIVALKAAALATGRGAAMGYAITPVQEIGDRLVEWADVVVSAVDSVSGRAFLAERCRIHGKPLVEAGFNGADLAISVFGSEPEDACYRCLNPALDGASSCRNYAIRAELAGLTPAIQNGAAALGGLQAENVIGLLHGEAPLLGRRAFLNIRTLAVSSARIPRSPGCPGIHESFIDRIELKIRPKAQATELLEEIHSRVGPARVRLPAPVIGRIGCTRCHKIVDAGVPYWRWLLAPLCIECGGKYSYAPGRVACEIGDELRTTVLGDLESYTCANIGVVPGTALPLYPAEGEPVVAIIDGDLDSVISWIS